MAPQVWQLVGHPTQNLEGILCMSGSLNLFHVMMLLGLGYICLRLLFLLLSLQHNTGVSFLCWSTQEPRSSSKWRFPIACKYKGKKQKKMECNSCSKYRFLKKKWVTAAEGCMWASFEGKEQKRGQHAEHISTATDSPYCTVHWEVN